MSEAVYAVLFLVGMAAGFVDSIAGGGGLVALPALLAAGLPPQVALGTNKLQSSFGSFTASIQYIRKGQVKVRNVLPGIVYTAIGAATGSAVVQQLEPGFIRHLIPILLLLVLIYTIVVRDFGGGERTARMPAHLFYLVFGFSLGFYDGFFGPGAGSFWTAAFVIVMGQQMTRAAGHTRVVNFTSNVVALGGFILGGNVYFSVGICMAAGQIIGARLGSGMAIQRGAGFIRPVFMAVVFLTILRLMYSNYGPYLFS